MGGRVRWPGASVGGDCTIPRWLQAHQGFAPLRGRLPSHGEGDGQWRRCAPSLYSGKSAFEGDVSWNFAGIFLFDKEGECVGRYDAKALKELKEQVASALA